MLDLPWFSIRFTIYCILLLDLPYWGWFTMVYYCWFGWFIVGFTIPNQEIGTIYWVLLMFTIVYHLLGMVLLIFDHQHLHQMIIRSAGWDDLPQDAQQRRFLAPGDHLWTLRLRQGQRWLQHEAPERRERHIHLAARFFGWNISLDKH